MNDVSRETAAAQVAAVFADLTPKAERFAELLAEEGVTRGLIGPREVPRMWDRHILNCAVVQELIAPSADVLDIGTGAGLPGIPLALARPDLWITLVEPMERRVLFLDEAVTELGLQNVEVLRARAEEVEPRGKAGVVVSRALAPLPKLTAWCLPLARIGGTVLAVKGASAADELHRARTELKRGGVRDAEVVSCGSAHVNQPTTVIRMVRAR